MGLVEEDLELSNPHLGLEFTTTIRVTVQYWTSRMIGGRYWLKRVRCVDSTSVTTKPGAIRYCKRVKSGLMFWFCTAGLASSRVMKYRLTVVHWECRPEKKRAFVVVATSLADNIWPETAN